ncbi:hypothetical protein BDV96DRAFT_684588 [Lophiotrema nucula]|uniref:Uncharacterized protein n=1 Tax=Lophiotrema nucula TaxID=690887 RepID=A0A6A5ZL28_9PLEO|nr:hypothetical protein BDV96DRAFT_684588 [Lophiotrema nucula]
MSSATTYTNLVPQILHNHPYIYSDVFILFIIGSTIYVYHPSLFKKKQKVPMPAQNGPGTNVDIPPKTALKIDTDSDDLPKFAEEEENKSTVEDLPYHPEDEEDALDGIR